MPSEFIWAHFSGANSADFYQRIVREHSPVFTAPENSVVLDQLTLILNKYKSGVMFTEIERSQRIYSILCNLLFPGFSSIDNAVEDRVIGKAIEFIKDSLSDDITLDSIARHVHLSSFHFAHLFKRQTGFSPYEYIMISRFNLAKHLLKSTDKSIDEISEIVGYKSSTGFIAAFSKKEGLSPSKYRRQPI